MANKHFRIVDASYTNPNGRRVHRFFVLFSHDVIMWSTGWISVIIISGSVTGLYRLIVSYCDHEHVNGARAVKEIDGEYTMSSALNMARGFMRHW